MEEGGWGCGAATPQLTSILLEVMETEDTTNRVVSARPHWPPGFPYLVEV